MSTTIVSILFTYAIAGVPCAAAWLIWELIRLQKTVVAFARVGPTICFEQNGETRS